MSHTISAVPSSLGPSVAHDEEPRLPESPPGPHRATVDDPMRPAPVVPREHVDVSISARQLLRPFWFVGALLMMLDGLTTYIALEFFSVHGAREGNPLAVWAMEHLGLAGMCALKVVIGVALMWRLAATADRGHRFGWMNRSLLWRPRPLWKVQRSAAWSLAFSLVLMGVVVGNNVRAIIGLWNG